LFKTGVKKIVPIGERVRNKHNLQGGQLINRNFDAGMSGPIRCAGFSKHKIAEGKVVAIRAARLPGARENRDGGEMRNVIVLACATLMIGGFVFGQKPQGSAASADKAPAPSELTSLLDAKIKAEWQAIKDKDRKAYGDLLTEEYVGVEADGGGERYKWKVLNELQDSSVIDFTLSFLKVTPLCTDAAFARYEVFIKFPPKSTVRFEKVLVGEIWVKREGQWKSLHYQETRVK
jgi:hypothetical protein